MSECNYVYVVVNINCGIPIKNKIFSTYAKADTYRKIWCEKYPQNTEYYIVETLEVD